MEGNYEHRSSTCLISNATQEVIAERSGFHLIDDSGKNK
jgi:hypothetical protein